LILSSAVSQGWCLHQLDDNNVFLHDVVEEDIFMQRSLGSEENNPPRYIFKLVKALHGLKQAPRA
jgi:hypothetical protein